VGWSDVAPPPGAAGATWRAVDGCSRSSSASSAGCGADGGEAAGGPTGVGAGRGATATGRSASSSTTAEMPNAMPASATTAMPVSTTLFALPRHPGGGPDAPGVISVH
jgi:hypothetical protein